jgi:hypothetical protein
MSFFQSLVLQQIDRQRSGAFTCEAVNAVGKGSSLPIFLDVKCEFKNRLFSEKMKDSSGRFLSSPLGAKFDPQGDEVGETLTPRGEFWPIRENFLCMPLLSSKSRVCSPLNAGW